MEYHGIDMVGPFKVERLATKPTWVSSDEGRLIYAEDLNLMYYGADTDWVIIQDLSAAGILARLLTVHGAGSGLDADLWDNQQFEDFLEAGNPVKTDSTPTFAGIDTGDGVKILGGTAITDGDTVNIPTADEVFDFVNSKTGDRAVITSSSGIVTTSTTTSAEIGYLSGLSSNAQSQLNTLTSTKQNNIVGAASTVTNVNLAVEKVVVTNSSGKITDSTVDVSDLTKIPEIMNLTSGRALKTNASTGIIEESDITSDELDALDGINTGVGSTIQTQLDGKQATVTGAATTIVINDLSENRALISNASGKVTVSDVTSTELGYLDGVTSNVQTQFSGKQNTINGAASTIDTEDLTAERAVVSDTDGKISASAITSTELGYLDSVTSNVQTQLNGKQATITGAATTIVINDLSVDRVMVSNSSGKCAVSSVTTDNLNDLIGLTPSRALRTNSSTGNIEVSPVTSTELGYLDGVTSNVQTQFSGKQNTINGAATTITSNNLTTNRALISNASGKVAVSAVTSTELSYMENVTSDVQLQLDDKGTMIKADTTIYLATTGSDVTGDGSPSNPYYSINKAFDYLADKIIDRDVTVTIQLANGTYNYTEVQMCNHTNGNNIVIKGQNTYTTTISSVTNYSGTDTTNRVKTTGNVVQAVVVVASSSNIAVGDYLLIRDLFASYDATGVYNNRGEALPLNGVFKVTNVSGTSVTLYNVFRQSNGSSITYINTALTGSRRGNVTVIKTVLSFTNSNGIKVTEGNSLGSIQNPGLDKLVVVNTNFNSDYTGFADYEEDVPYDGSLGIAAINGGTIITGHDIGVTQWKAGIDSDHTSTIYCNHVCVTGCEFSIQAAFSSSVICNYAHTSGNWMGPGAYHNSSLKGQYQVAVAAEYGYPSNTGSGIWTHYSNATRHNIGVWSESSATCESRYMTFEYCYEGMRTAYSSMGVCAYGKFTNIVYKSLRAILNSCIAYGGSTGTLTTDTSYSGLLLNWS